MIIAALAAAVLHLAQPVATPCAPAGLGLGAGGAAIADQRTDQQPISGPVDRGSVVDFLVSVYNNGPESYAGVELSVRIDSARQVARLDRMTVEISDTGGPWRRLDRSAGTPEFSFAAPVATFPLPVAIARNFRVRMHLDPAQPGSLLPSVVLAISGRNCELNAGFPLDVRRPESFASQPNRSLPLLLGVAAGVAGALAGYWLWSRRQPARFARSARS